MTLSHCVVVLKNAFCVFAVRHRRFLALLFSIMAAASDAAFLWAWPASLVLSATALPGANRFGFFLPVLVVRISEVSYSKQQYLNEELFSSIGNIGTGHLASRVWAKAPRVSRARPGRLALLLLRVAVVCRYIWWCKEKIFSSKIRHQW